MKNNIGLNKPKIYTGFALMFFAMLGVGISSYVGFEKFEESSHWVIHSNQVRQAPLNILSTMENIEMAQRDYMVTGDEKYLEAYLRLRNQVISDLETLKDLTASTPAQQMNREKLQALIEKNLVRADRNLELFKKGNKRAALRRLGTVESRDQLESIRISVEHVGDIEDELLVERGKTDELNLNGAIGVLLISFASAFFFSMAAIYFIARELKIRQSAQKELLKSEEDFRRTIVSIKDYAIVTMDEKGVIQSWNEGAEKIKGFAADEVLGKNISMFYPPEEVKAGIPKEILRKAAEQGHVKREVWRQRKDGSTFLADMVMTALKGERGEVRSYVTVFQDVTIIRDEQQALLRKQEAQLRVLMENANDAIFLLGLDGQIISSNLQSEKLLEIPREQIVGRTYLEFAAPHEWERAKCYMGRVAQGEKIPPQEFQLLLLDGKSIFVEFSLVTLPSVNEKVYMAIGRDVTERKKALEDKVRLSAIVESSSDAILGIDLEGVVTVWNSAAEHLYGYQPEEIIGHHISVMTLPENYHEMYRRLEVCKRGEVIPIFETVHQSKGLKKLDVSINYSLLKDVAGKVTGISIIIRDISERKRAEASLQKSEEQLRESQKMEAIGQLSAGIAHDFNNILNIVSGNSELVLSEMGEDDPGREEIEEIQKAVLRGAQLTQQLLVFGRKDVSQPVVLCLNEVVSETTKMLERMIGEDIDLIVRPASDLKMIKADPIHIQQILMNLLSNARDAMPDGGKILVETRNTVFEQDFPKGNEMVLKGNYVLLSVNDTGMGMDEEIQKRIFEPFFTTKETGKGTGLGLATVYGAVKKSDGYIWVYSEPGEGTSFNILFPVVESVETAGLVPKQVPLAGGVETVLLVEDERSLRTIMARTLEKQGYVVIQAQDGEEGLAKAVQYLPKIDLVLTDTVMPKMSGKVLVDKIKDLRPDLKVIFTSGYSRQILSNKGIVDPNIQLIHKPFSNDVLLSKVREVLDGKLN